MEVDGSVILVASASEEKFHIIQSMLLTISLFP